MIIGHGGDHTLQGLGGKDVLHGGGGDDILIGGTGKNILYGGNGADKFLFDDPQGFGNKNRDSIQDFNHDEGDSLAFDKDVFGLGKLKKVDFASNYKKIWMAAKSNDNFVYNDNNGLLYFNENGDEKGWGRGGLFVKLQGTPEFGIDNSNKNNGGDNSNGSNKNDILNGTNRKDSLIGTNKDDVIIGKKGNDILKGEKGNDVIFGGLGRDKLYGGKGDDIFLITRESSIGADNIDSIYDFQNSKGKTYDFKGGDIIRLQGFGIGRDGITLRRKGKDTVIDYYGDTIAVIHDSKFTDWLLGTGYAGYTNLMIKEQEVLFPTESYCWPSR